MSRAKIDKNSYKKVGESRGIKWLGIELPRYTADKTTWECIQNHMWNTSYNKIYLGQGCPKCARIKASLKEYDYKKLAEKRKFKWLSLDVPKNIATKTLWECENEHQFYARYHNINQGTGCPKCAKRAKLTEIDYHNTGKDRNIKWIDTILPKYAKTKTWWECDLHQKKYKWETSYDQIRSGAGCPKCAKNDRKHEEDYQIVGHQTGIQWVGKILPKNTEVITDDWICLKCPEPHKIKTSYRYVKNGMGCPNQAKSRSEKLCRFYFEEALIAPFPSCRPDFLKYKNKFNLELDGYNKEYQIAFEYQGIQHYEDRPKFFHKNANNNLKYQQEKDAWKAQICEEMGIKLFIIPYTYNCYNPDKMRNFIYDSLFYL